MGLPFAIALLLASGWVYFATIRHLLRNGTNWTGWLGFGLLAVAGVAAGLWLARFEYQPTERMRVLGFPLPVVAFVWEEDRWTDFVTPLYYAYPAMVANVLTTSAVVVAPFSLSCVLFRRRQADQPNKAQ